MEDSGIGIAAAQKAVLNSASSDTSAISSSSSYECTLSQSTEDFTIVAPRAMITSVSKSQYCQVVFHGVSDVYPTDSDVKCRYTLTSDVNAQPGDKVALFRVGWLSVSEYITFERAPQPNEDGSNLYVTFTAGKLPKDTSSLYQLCYVTSGNVIAGASTPFTFHVPSESELVAVEDPTDPSMVVFKSRVSQLQCDLQTKTEEYQQLHLKQGLVEEKVHVLRMELDKVEAALKQSNDKVAELYTNKQSLEIDNKVLQERLTQFQQETHTVEALEEKLNQMKTEKNDCQEQLEELNKVQQKYEEIKKGFLSAKMENVELVARLSATYEALQEKTRCVESQLPTIHCLEQDCERSTRALKEQARLVESLSTQNEELSKKLRLLAVEHDKTKLENIVLSGRCMEAEKVAKNQTTSPRAATELEEEKEMLQVMLMTLEEHHSKCEEKILRLTAQLSEISFTPERQSDSASAIAGAVKQVATYFGIPPTPGGVRAHPTRPTSGDFDTNDEVAQLEKQLLEFKQDQATKKNRIEVLEIELRAAKDELLKLKKSPVGDSKPDCMLASNHLEVLSAGLPVINKFNEQVLVLSLLEEKITAERSENAELKNKIVDLLAKDSEMCGELRNLREKYDVAAKQLELLEATPEKETLDMLHQVLDHCVAERTEAKSELKAELEAKEKLEQQVVLLRAESVGKVSVDNSRKFHESIHVLESQVAEMEKFINYMKKFIHYTFDKRENKPIICPLCPTEFPHTAGKKFAAHFKQQHMK